MSAGVLTGGFGSLTVAEMEAPVTMLVHEAARTTATNTTTKATTKDVEDMALIGRGEPVSEQRW